MVNSLSPFSIFGGSGNFFNNFCGPITEDLCENNVNVCVPKSPDGGERLIDASFKKDDELYNLIDCPSGKTLTKYDPVINPVIGTSSG